MPRTFTEIIHTGGLFRRFFLRIFEQLCGQRLRPAHRQALFDHGMVVEGQCKQIGQPPAASGFGIGCAIHHTAQPAVDNGPAAHGAGLQRNKQLALPQPPPAQLFARTADGQQLGMMGGVFFGFARVVCHCNGLTVQRHHRPHGHFFHIGCQLRLLQGQLHKFKIRHTFITCASTMQANAAQNTGLCKSCPCPVERSTG